MKVVKKIGKGIKNVFKGVKKVFKEITSSKIGKALLIAGAIYLGGAAFGMWNTPFSSVNGAFVGGGGNAASVAATGEAAGTAAVAEGPSAAAKLGSMVGKESATLSGATTKAALPSATGAATKLPAEYNVVSDQAKLNSLAQSVGKPVQAGGTTAKQGIVKSMMGKTGRAAKSIGSFIKDNQTASIIALNTAAGMASPDEIDLMNLQREYEYRERERREKNLDVAGIDLGFSNTKQPLTYADGRPVYANGIVQSRMLRRS